MYDVAAEKKAIKQSVTPRATTTRVVQILGQQGIEIDRKKLHEWFRFPTRLAQHDAEIISAYWQAIRERTEKFQKLAVPEKRRAITLAKRLAEMSN